MARQAAALLAQAVRTAQAADTLCDRALLERYVTDGDQHAFAALVNRHMAMVLGVCRRTLHSQADADDACQAVFLLLARKAKENRWQASVANWLYATARKVSQNARLAAARRTRREGTAAVPETVTPVDPVAGWELVAALDEELERLPPRYREPLVLCYLEGLTRDEAAARLGVTKDALKKQLERGRKKLADALTARGCAFGVALLASATAAVAGASPPRLVDSILVAIDGSPSEIAAALVQEMAMNGVSTYIKLAVAAVIGTAAIGLGFASVLIAAESPKPATQLFSRSERAETLWKQTPLASNVFHADDKPAQPAEPPDPEPEAGGWVPATAYSRDGKLLALTRGDTRKVTLYETKTWKPLHTLEGMKELSHAVVFSGDGGTLYAASNDGVVYSWNTKTGNAGAKLDAKAGPCTGLILSPNGKLLASAHANQKEGKPAIHLWDATTGKSVGLISSEEYLLPNTIAFTADGKGIAGGYHATHKPGGELSGFHGVIEWDVNTGKEIKRYDTPRITPGATPVAHAIAYTHDGRWLILGGGESVPIPGMPGASNLFGYLWVFDRKTGKVEKTLVDRRQNYVRLLALSPDGSKLYVPTYTPPLQVVRNGRLVFETFSELQCWDTTKWTLDWNVTNEPATVTGIAVAPNGKRVGVSDTYGFRLHDAATGDAKGGLVKAKDR